MAPGLGELENMAKEQDEESLPVAFGSSFSDRTIRMNFIRKVYSIIFIQLLVTTLIVAPVIFSKSIKTFMCQTDPYVSIITEGCVYSTQAYILYGVSYGMFIITYLAIACCERVRRKSPGNVIALSILTLAMSMLVAIICLFHDVVWVMMAMGITSALCLGLTLFSFQTKIDFTGIGPSLFVACWCLFVFGIMAIIVALTTGLTILSNVYSSLAALLFSLFLIFDTQRIMGGKKHSISPEDYIWASIEIYIDIVYIFVAILGSGGRN